MGQAVVTGVFPFLPQYLPSFFYRADNSASLLLIDFRRILLMVHALALSVKSKGHTKFFSDTRWDSNPGPHEAASFQVTHY